MSNYPGIYEAVVHDLGDPQRLGRARLLVPAVLGKAMSAWALPVLGPNSSAHSKVGDRAWVLFEHGDLSRPTWFGALPARYPSADHVHEPVSAHLNPSLDSTSMTTVGSGVEVVPARLMPTDWTWFWGAGTPKPTLEAVSDQTVYNDGRSLKVTIHATGSYATVQSSIFAVTAGSIVSVSAWVRSTGPRAFLTIFTSDPASNPDFSGGSGVTTNDSPIITPGAEWQKITHSFVVPYGHTKARFALRQDDQPVIGSVWWDETTAIVTTPPPVGVETGEIKMWPTATPPAGYLFCNGGSFSSVTYPALAALLGDIYGTHSDTTYYLPDFRGRSPLGIGGQVPQQSAGWNISLGQKYGSVHPQQHNHSGTTGSQNRFHEHTIPFTITQAIYSWGVTTGGGAAYVVAGSAQVGTESTWHEHSFTTENSGSGADGNLHPILGINFIIKT